MECQTPSLLNLLKPSFQGVFPPADFVACQGNQLLNLLGVQIDFSGH